MSESPNRILEFLTSPARPDGDACRTNRRLRSASNVELAWAVGDGWRTIRGRLRDISRAGAGVIALAPPPEGARARLRLADGEGTPWVEATVLGVESVSRKRNRVRLRFAEPCPSFLLRLAVLGPAEEDEVEQAPAAPAGWVAWGHARDE